MDLLSKLSKEQNKEIISEFFHTLSPNDIKILKNYFIGMNINKIAMILGESYNNIFCLLREIEDIFDSIKIKYESEPDLCTLFFGSINAV